MKRLILSTIMVVIGLSAFSQSPSRLISLQPAYPIAIGESIADNYTLSANNLYLYDIELDSLPQYEIGYIDEQTLRYFDDGYGFYVKADSLHSQDLTFNCEVSMNSEQPQGVVEFNETTGRFMYYRGENEYETFTLIFSATNGIETISENVLFNIVPRTPSEADTFYTTGTMPDAGDFITIAEVSQSKTLNNYERSARSISISGKDVIFDDAVHNKVWGLSGCEDIYELNIFAERLIIRSALSFPQTNITVYAKELIFEDHDTVFASINTTPTPIEVLTNGGGRKGADAGNISLYVKNFKANIGIRFVLCGAIGQSTNRNGIPGNGGNGGTVFSNIDVSNYCDFARGNGGIKYDVAEDGYANTGPIIGYGENGNNGHFELIKKSYLHPWYVAAVIRHANEAFINNYTDYALQICREYRELIDEHVNSLNEGLAGSDGLDEVDNDNANIELDLHNNLLEINNMLFKLEQGLDYFGNPVGWVPLLSFEVYLKNYENEIERAIPTLYMYYWMNRVDQTLQNMVSASQVAANNTEKAIDDNIENLNSLTLEIPVIEDEANEIAAMIKELTDKMTFMQNYLMAKASKNVKKQKKKQQMFEMGKILANVLTVVPGFGPFSSSVLSTAGSVLSTSLSIASSIDSNKNIDYSTVLNSIKSFGSKKNNVQEQVKDAEKSVTKKDSTSWYSACESLYESIKPLYENFNAAYKVLNQSSATSGEIQQEFDKLKAAFPYWKEIEGSLAVLNDKKIQLENHINQVVINIATSLSELNNDAIALDAFRQDAFTDNSKRDLNAMIYMAKLEQRAKDRLMLYDYYLRKAYEYRLLKPYEGEDFNLVGMFERFERLGLALDSVVNKDAYEALGTIFRERISDMTEKILKEYTANYSEQSAPITIVIPKEQLDIINSDENVTLNFQEMGVFSPDEENVRIVNIEVLHMDTHIDGNVGFSGYMDLNMTHSGISKFRKDGHLYWFDHMSRSSRNPHTWGVRYDAITGENNQIQPSAANTSLLYSLLGNNDNVMLFSRPSAWSDITLSKKVHTSWGADIMVDSLVIRLQYDFTRHPSTVRNIDVCASDGLMPYITCSEEDINGRSSGKGHLLRSFRTTGQPITYTAADKYETYYFVNWTDRAGRVYSDKPELKVTSRSRDQFYIANYERRVPILNIPDTIKVSNEGNEYVVYVNNIGSGDLEMDWYVSDSLSTWVHLNGVTEGIDNGYFTFTVDSNTNGTNRLDSLEIFTPETDAMSKTIYIAQVDGTFDEDKVESIEGDSEAVRIYPNPMRDFVNIEGEDLLSVSIYSISGKEMYRRGLKNRNFETINVGNLPNGVYIITVNTKDGMVSKKLLKAK